MSADKISVGVSRLSNDCSVVSTLSTGEELVQPITCIPKFPCVITGFSTVHSAAVVSCGDNGTRPFPPDWTISLYIAAVLLSLCIFLVARRKFKAAPQSGGKA